ncbi:NUDIX hydrolase [Candidatus Saganbacteria bacterium]|uniref:NUDIX hydrolase n=1 Tax=Candidatus Saganbacteria bacterium TaxID=2575572 RepID=A0A9D6YT75_UNCSA|nr:NUDIX hydrolase [Candidatus Saganbacteria bacterium]
MDKFEEKKLNSEKVFKGRLLGVRVDTVELPTGKIATREIVEHPGAVAVVAITDENELVMIRQFRRAAGEILLEVPAGVPQEKEEGEAAARRELEEETGYRAKKVKKVWEGYVSPGYSTELIQYYLALDMNAVKQRPDEDEFIEVEMVDIEACLELVRTGKIRDNKTIVGVMIADLFVRGEL